MKNMGTTASLSISILRDEQLWGLIACHHATPWLVPFEVRTACEYLAQILSLQLTSREHRADYEQLMQLQGVQQRLLTAIAYEESFVEGLRLQSADLLALVAAHGAAILHKGQCLLLGRTPTAEQIDALVEWLAEQGSVEVFATDGLAQLYPPAGAFKDEASGLLAIAISKLHQSYILWFRPEILQTVRWGGDPRQPAENGDGKALHPRRSFETWKEEVRLRALSWKKSEYEAAVNLRNAVVGLVLRKVEEMEQLTAQLEQSNRELEAFSYSVSHDLRAPLRHIRGFAELLHESDAGRLSEVGDRYLQTILTAARLAGELVDHLLSFSRIGRTTLQPTAVAMDALVGEVCREVMAEAAGRDIDWKLHPLPEVWVDPIMIRLVLWNLLANAVKYTRPRAQAVIEMGCRDEAGEFVFSVRDNGVGFDMAYARKLFGVFQRLHRLDELEGTGIGLATVRRIIARHGGRTWAEGVVDRGATFYFSLPGGCPGARPCSRQSCWSRTTPMTSS
jgi:light-regulated signal transduction histidine kinase (bacteriophytochrome)